MRKTILQLTLLRLYTLRNESFEPIFGMESRVYRVCLYVSVRRPLHAANVSYIVVPYIVHNVCVSCAHHSLPESRIPEVVSVRRFTSSRQSTAATICGALAVIPVLLHYTKTTDGRTDDGFARSYTRWLKSQTLVSNYMYVCMRSRSALTPVGMDVDRARCDASRCVGV